MTETCGYNYKYEQSHVKGKIKIDLLLLKR